MISRQSADLTGLQQAFPYPRSGDGATTDLAGLLREDIAQDGPMPFADYMARCLYHPELGYYARPQSPTVSKRGDFVTSVSVGPVFGALLARRLHRFWRAHQSPDSFTIVEPGPHDGSLALDILDAAASLDPTFRKAIRYLVVEPLEARRPVLVGRLGDQAEVVASPSEITAPFGALVANEVLDALPVPLYLRSRDEWHEVLVTDTPEQLDWATRPATLPLSGDFPEGYVTEGTPDFAEFLAPYSRIFERGLQIWIDYGLDESSLHHPHRTAGTLRCFRRHRTGGHPLDHPGEQDLTADVNFTAFEDAARSRGLTVHPAMNQSRYLTYAGREWLLESPSPAEVSQFQTLIHPTQFGNRFHALELTVGRVERAFP